MSSEVIYQSKFQSMGHNQSECCWTRSILIAHSSSFISPKSPWSTTLGGLSYASPVYWALAREGGHNHLEGILRKLTIQSSFPLTILLWKKK